MWKINVLVTLDDVDPKKRIYDSDVDQMKRIVDSDVEEMKALILFHKAMVVL